MSETGESVEHETELEQDNEEQLKVQKAILAGIAILIKMDPQELMDMVEGD